MDRKAYRPFVATYPTHPRAGDALFEIAQVTWAYGGYPQAVGYLPPDGPIDSRVAHRAFQEKALDPWFDTGGFGGEVDTGPPDPAKARAAQATFRRIVDKYPTSGLCLTPAIGALTMDYVRKTLWPLAPLEAAPLPRARVEHATKASAERCARQ